MGLRQGVQAEVLSSLALVMITGTGLLAAVILELGNARVEALHGVLAQGFASASREAALLDVDHRDGVRWWRFDANGQLVGNATEAAALDGATEALAVEALSKGERVVLSGAPWEPIRFASPRGTAAGAMAGRIDAPVSGKWLLVLVVTNVLVFAFFGVTLLRRRVVGPLHRLAESVREIGEGELAVPVPEEGTAEIEGLGAAFNEMQAALAARTGALEKAVVELREANASLRQAREGLDRAERLSMVGSLAAGVAHEVGNPMGALLAFLDVAARDDGLSEPSQRALGKASEQGERVRRILRQLLDFSRPPQVQHGPIDLGPLARQAADLVQAQAVYAEIDFEFEGHAAPAIGDASLAAQILLNLAINAAGAVEGRSERRVRITLSEGPLVLRATDGSAATDAIGRCDATIVRVEDSGTGVAQADAARIFDPFYTTKPPGEGTGLGLANARRIAEEMGGQVELDAPQGALGGAVFSFRLPRARGGDEDRSVIARERARR